MIQHCPVLIVLLPLTAALLCLLFSKFNKNLGSWLVIGSIAGSLACSLQLSTTGWATGNRLWALSL